MSRLAARGRRLTAYFLLYIVAGIPLGISATIAATQLRRGGIGMDAIGTFVGLQYLPWGLCWLITPLINLIGSRRMGRRRSWIVFTQLGMILGLLMISWVDPIEKFQTYSMMMLAISALAAIQNTAVNALAENLLDERSGDRAHRLMMIGFYLGHGLGGAVLLAICTTLDRTDLAFTLSALMIGIATVVVVLPMKEPMPWGRSAVRGKEVARNWVGHLRSFALSVCFSWRGLVSTVFALMPHGALMLGFALQAAIAVDMGLSNHQISMLCLLTSLTAVIGTIAGSRLSKRRGSRSALTVYALLTIVPTLLLAIAMLHHHWIFPADTSHASAAPDALLHVFWAGSITHNLFGGLALGARAAVLTRTQVPPFVRTMTITLAGIVIGYSAIWQGNSIVQHGYPTTLFFDAAIGSLCILLLPLIRQSKDVAGR